MFICSGLLSFSMFHNLLTSFALECIQHPHTYTCADVSTRYRGQNNDIFVAVLHRCIWPCRMIESCNCIICIHACIHLFPTHMKVNNMYTVGCSVPVDINTFKKIVSSILYCAVQSCTEFNKTLCKLHGKNHYWCSMFQCWWEKDWTKFFCPHALFMVVGNMHGRTLLQPFWDWHRDN